MSEFYSGSCIFSKFCVFQINRCNWKYHSLSSKTNLPVAINRKDTQLKTGICLS